MRFIADWRMGVPVEPEELGIESGPGPDSNEVVLVNAVLDLAVPHS